MVSVLNRKSHPLMPCSPRTARLLLAQGKAKVVAKDPFTIQLLYGSSGYRQDMEEHDTADTSQKRERTYRTRPYFQKERSSRWRNPKGEERNLRVTWNRNVHKRKKRRYHV